MRTASRVLLAALIAVATGCASAKVAKDLNDTTPPDVVIKVRGTNGQYAAATDATLSVTGNLDLMCIASDMGGISKIDLTFSGAADHCTTGDGGIYNGVFTITPLPNALQQTLQGDASGKVLSSLPMLATLAGPFACSIPGVGKGIPYGDTITVTCTGSNWSQNAQKKSTTQKLNVKLF